MSLLLPQSGLVLVHFARATEAAMVYVELVRIDLCRVWVRL